MSVITVATLTTFAAFQLGYIFQLSRVMKRSTVTHQVAPDTRLFTHSY